ncbi:MULTISPECIES: O-antigen ligase family protein [Caballeronia]|uniref:O-antigen ligase family protein n=1 Tax=Caballeronia TaxID=1827195 RepID=UPI001E44801F|nr:MULTISPECIES: O-antigen ligase family protein [unclassified Caballeronia]MCE4542385.1 O-antigen ligase family protein [Caballeronia sp. PC1]MCE4568560.1 O-antigen ligase family protein [Caballeronia sp. CLC5]
MQVTHISMLGRSGTESYSLFLARWFALITLSLIPISTAGVNVGSAAFALFAFISPEVWRRARPLLTWTAGATAALALFVVLSLSLAYSSAGFAEAFDFLMKYRKLLFIPLLLLVFADDAGKLFARAAVWSLFATLVLSMVLTYTNAFGWTSLGPMHADDPVRRPWVFKDHISGGLMMAFLVCLSFALAKAASGWRSKVLYLVALLALINVLFVLQGRTGQVVAIAYVAIYLVVQAAQFRRYDKRSRLLAGVGVAAVCVCIAAFVLYAKDRRLADTAQEVSQFETQNKNTSMGVRLLFYRRSIELMSHRPIAGYGVGSVRTQFERLASAQTGGHAAMAGNPHNEFFLMGVQLGLIGVALFVWFLIAIGRECRRLAEPAKLIAIGYLFAFVLGCLANSLLLNFTEGNLFVFLIGVLIGAGRGGERA